LVRFWQAGVVADPRRPASLLDDDRLTASAVVANCAMNRERQLTGVNSYTRELGFNPVDVLMTAVPSDPQHGGTPGRGRRRDPAAQPSGKHGGQQVSVQADQQPPDRGRGRDVADEPEAARATSSRSCSQLAIAANDDALAAAHTATVSSRTRG
jgi:hypothetical protein